MAIVVDESASPIIITGTTGASEVITLRARFVQSVYWYKPTTLGHLLSVTDGNGRTVTRACVAVADEGIIIPVNAVYDSLYCDDMDSGILYIYHR